MLQAKALYDIGIRVIEVAITTISKNLAIPQSTAFAIIYARVNKG
ncbi:hypothetical protein [Yersinia frederiksenii]|nr:hypothetical protein [Yersinia frederiksenii]